MKRRGSVLLFSLVKAAITITLIVIIAAKIDFAVLARHLGGAGTVYLILGALLLAANIPLVALRWWLLLRRLDVESISLGYAYVANHLDINGVDNQPADGEKLGELPGATADLEHP